MMRENNRVVCPFCGEAIERKAAACPHCGSDERTGWSNTTYLDGIDLGDDIDYDELAKREFPHRGHSFVWWKSWKTITGIVLLLLFVLFSLRYIF